MLSLTWTPLNLYMALELKNGCISVLQRHIYVAKCKWKRFNKSDRYPIREHAWSDQGYVQPRKNGAKRLLNGNGDALNTVLMTQVLQLWQLRRTFFVFFLKNFRSLYEIGINTCLILQNMLYVTVTALAVQNKREHPNRVKGFVETVVPNYWVPTLASHFRKKRQTFQLKDNPLTSETVLWSIWPHYFYCEY